MFVSIDVAGPTSASTEMILPNNDNQPSILCLPPGGCVAPVSANQAWNDLFNNKYGSDLNSDQPFVEEWKAAINTFGKVFSGVTLVLEDTGDSLPNFPTANTSLTTPAPGFEQDCSGSPLGTNANPNCVAVTQVLYHFVNPTVGGGNSKETQEAGLNASQNDPDGGFWGVKWLAAHTSGGSTRLPGTAYDMSQMLGGLQFGEPFSAPPANTQSEGCAQLYVPCSVPPKLKPKQALYNVLAHYFDGTVDGTDYDYPTPNPGLSGSDSVDDLLEPAPWGGNFHYAKARMNVLQVYAEDILYAGGLGPPCTPLEITGNPDAASPVPPDTSTCQQTAMPRYDNHTAQDMLNQASEQILSQAQ
jgi:hypothetical protein